MRPSRPRVHAPATNAMLTKGATRYCCLMHIATAKHAAAMVGLCATPWVPTSLP